MGLHLRRAWLYAIGALAALFLVSPILLVIPMSFSNSQFLTFPPPGWSLQWYRVYFGSDEWLHATIVSLQVAVGASLVATGFGAAAAYGLHRTTSGLKGIIYAILLLPALVPTVLIAVGVFIAFAKIGLNNTVMGLTLAHAALALPFVVVLVAAGLKQAEPSLELAARSLGAHPVRAFFDVTLPQIKFSILSATLIAFLTSFDEVVVSLFISGGGMATLPKKMFSSLRDETDPVIAAVATLLTSVSLILVLASQFKAPYRAKEP